MFLILYAFVDANKQQQQQQQQQQQ